MKLVVCVKQVAGELNPFDACALEAALQIQGAEITVVSMGRADVTLLLQRLTRLGVDAALLCDNTFAGADTLATSYALACFIRRVSPDYVFCGRQSIDGDTAQTGPCLAAQLGFSVATNVMRIDEISRESVSVTDREMCRTLASPALLTFERINTLRFPGIRARERAVEILTAKDIGADTARCGLCGSPTRVVRTFESSLGRRKCRYISLAELLETIRQCQQLQKRELAPVGEKVKLPSAWAIGEEAANAAREIAGDVRVIPRDSAKKLAELIRREHPDVVLWPADLWGRREAPQVAGLLQTGLCADCTQLETDGTSLFMYRPAFGGAVTAKIVCKSRPQMATVRVEGAKTKDVMLAAGLGAASHFSQLRHTAEKNGWAFGASRGAVDRGLCEYEMQIGLTGKTVTPRVYLAFGISGAVHHTCAIERAGTVIAVNHDRNARILEYADYGVIADCGDALLAIQD